MTGLSRALNVVADKEGKKTTIGGGGLTGALARRQTGAATNAAAPRTSNLEAVKEAITSSDTTNTAFGNKGICFVIDATASREHSWREAQAMQAKMFDAIKSAGSDTQVGIICHRGQRVESLGWFNDANSAKRSMAEIGCISGVTQVCDSLIKASEGNTRAPSSVILVGDCFEENHDQILKIAQQFKVKNIRVFAFLEGHDEAAAQAFQAIANMTGGAFKRFGDGLNLADLCVAAATFDTGGKAAFDRLIQSGHSGARALESQINRRALDSGSKISAAPRV